MEAALLKICGGSFSRGVAHPFDHQNQLIFNKILHTPIACLMFSSN
jgi:hypothetical protein